MQFSTQDLREISGQASTLAERVCDASILDNCHINETLANSKIEQWCKVVAQGDCKKFEKRLAWDNLNFNKIRHILGSTPTVTEKELPKWTKTLNQCLKASETITLDILDTGIKENHLFNSQQPIPFEESFIPFIYTARERLLFHAGSKYHLLSKIAHSNLERYLLGWLSCVCSQSLELEFSIFRSSKSSTLARRLQKSTNHNSTKYYKSFVKDLLSGGWLIFFREYPVLARLVATMVDFWVDTTKEFLCNLDADWSEIQSTFQPDTELGEVESIETNLSDRHHNGRSVMAITFTSGLKLIYKPKCLEIEQAYISMLAWLNKKGAPLSFKIFKILSRSKYGWVEFVDTLPCKDREEAIRYFQRSGILLCLMYFLDATDLHYENIIACGEDPVLIDLETIMHPRVRENKTINDSNLFAANHQIFNSVLRTGFLPLWNIGSANQAYDVSGLGGVEQQKTSFSVQQFLNINTDMMKLDYIDKKTKNRNNSPFLNKSPLLFKDYHREIIDGFQKMYHFLIKKRRELLEKDSPLKKLDHQTVRFVFRQTSDYNLILATGLQPKYLRNGVDRSIHLDILSKAMLFSETKPSFWSLLDEEKLALEQMDIPLFTANSDSCNFTINSNKTLNKYFNKPSFDFVLSRLNALNIEDLKQQISLINGSLYARTSLDPHHFSLSDNFEHILSKVIPLTKEAMVQQAVKLAIALKKKAVCLDDGSVTWIAPQYLDRVQRLQVKPMGYRLYDGSCGVALFLAALAKVTGVTEFHDLALNALQPLRQDLQRGTLANVSKIFYVGESNGFGSIIYGLVRASYFLDESVILEDSEQIAALITSDMIAADNQFDIISGSAGTILGLLALHNICANSGALEKAIACGYHLLGNRVISNSGYRTWLTIDRKPLTGFSHGAAGIAYALLRLYQVTDEAVFLEAAQEAIAYERSVFIPEEGNWPDFRESSIKERPICMCSWCHGAPGIGLARVAGLDILDTPEIRQDIEAAIHTTKQHKLLGIDHICCGNLGRTEFLFTTGRKLSQPQLIETAMEQAAQVVARAKQKGGFAYDSILNFHPGFFQGASGIGYELLRLAYPNQLPSVLLWE